ncbi:uncharacterized protein OCT59_019849 [Rhizophagus irregularis]|uniref:F-box domain-containing protein n=1 Tax=Rhizophagus irregularis (strain DAOM 181602 / DAOM 197198 / MUCL 43194) TaxID=747089 RepID=A0A2H5S4X2_RHIID|nr:hypothetical protein GLOIN_2v1791592 [Rhizophagus irregularis DAOM 181602=DAOM 197198]POG57604.1 hypothetical protein GLOIN_2v1791592 [Rhizophagus irregularis DAOM 181602=DAOM 197198]UZO27659.1 hypothetical protein OCT59_019849 [Rhizophagus irregularis]CAB4482368.1 unnamed protein product [Rhizophagus irregularis]CAB5187438.1 unnamed protein product [Rhizophagus irregularis]|eukprot:XP_025164470.1 hypothetical protein GLOIN_2v1791592 [Rhizophagus irregularis DAOM 181602=DAOM 197198]
MTLPYLPDDCIYYILQHLQNDRSTLFNCLLVNRFWCKSTIPLLYANPFVNITEKNYPIILTLIFCFNKAEILQLKNQLGPSQINNINFDKEYKPLFEYPKYLENYNHFTINSVINRCFVGYCSDLSISQNKIYDDIIPIFHKSILRQSRNIKQIDILLHLFYKESFKNFNIKNFTSNLTKLNSLSLTFHLNGTFINNEIEQEFLSNIARNLRKLIINLPRTQRSLFQHGTSNNLINTTTMEKLCTIIQKQNKLKIFKIMNCHSLLNDILLSLEFQKHSLAHIEFTKCDFNIVSLKSFSNLYNLKYLTFESCKGTILLDQCEILNFASLKLKELSFKRNNWNVDVTSLMIKYLGESLQRLILIENLTIPVVENISMYCPNLVFLRIRIDNSFNLLVLPYLKNLRISILNINISYYNSNNVNEIFINLANNIPINISKISIYSCNFNKFGEFLKNCHNNFEIINLNHIIELEFLKIILNYIERSNNSLKIFGMAGLSKELNDEELKLLDQIKAKGVKIVEFYSFYNFYNYV